MDEHVCPRHLRPVRHAMDACDICRVIRDWLEVVEDARYQKKLLANCEAHGIMTDPYDVARSYNDLAAFRRKLAGDTRWFLVPPFSLGHGCRDCRRELRRIFGKSRR